MLSLYNIKSSVIFIKDDKIKPYVVGINTVQSGNPNPPKGYWLRNILKVHILPIFTVAKNPNCVRDTKAGSKLQDLPQWISRSNIILKRQYA